MPFTMNCPACSVSLKIPDELDGKKIKCKSCGTPFRAEQEEEDEPPARKKKPATKPKPTRDDDDERPSKARRSRSDEDDEDDEEDDDEPRSRRSSRDERPSKSKKKSAGKKKSGPPVLLLALLGGGFVVLLGVGILIYFLTRNGDGGGPGGSANVPLPPGWEEINDKAGGFRVYMQGTSIRQEAPGRMPANVKNSFRLRSVSGDGIHDFQVAVADFGNQSLSTDPAALKATLNQIDRTALFGVKIAAEREVKVGGKPGLEMELTLDNPDFGDFTVMRLTASGGKFYIITLTVENSKKDEKVRQTFFDSFRLQ